jgi:RNA polymerase sigma-70 factor (ECF subfamily)
MDASLLSDVHRRLFPKLYRYAHFRLDDEQLAEDAVSEAFTRLLEALARDRGPADNLSGWLMSTLSNVIMDQYRRVYAHPEDHLPDELAGDQGDPSTHLAHSDRMRSVRAALQKLTADQRHLLSLRFGSGLSLADSAEIMGRNINAVKALQHRALNALRRNLDEVHT